MDRYHEGVGKLMCPLPTNANVLSATSRFPPFPPPIMTLACYQQAGGGK